MEILFKDGKKANSTLRAYVKIVELPNDKLKIILKKDVEKITLPQNAWTFIETDKEELNIDLIETSSGNLTVTDYNINVDTIFCKSTYIEFTELNHLIIDNNINVRINEGIKINKLTNNGHISSRPSTMDFSELIGTNIGSFTDNIGVVKNDKLSFLYTDDEYISIMEEINNIYFNVYTLDNFYYNRNLTNLKFYMETLKLLNDTESSVIVDYLRDVYYRKYRHQRYRTYLYTKELKKDIKKTQEYAKSLEKELTFIEKNNL
jgi:hypothetical protein